MHCVRAYLKAQEPDPLLICEPLGCNCEIRYARSLQEETYDHAMDGTLNFAEKELSLKPVLLASETANPDLDDPNLNPLHILEPGLIRIPEALSLMSEIQLKGIVTA